MIDVSYRALLNPRDYLGVFRSQNLSLIEKVEIETGIYSFIFSITKPVTWQAGQHSLFSFPDRKIKGKNWRAFSIASSAHERVIRIATNIPSEPSDFKKTLLNMQSGDTIKMNGPFGEFHATGKSQHIVGIAGGIGITPFRAMAYDIAHGHLPNTKLTLIYSAATAHDFRSDLEAWQQKSDRLEVIFTKQTTEVQSNLENQCNIFGNDADYYISGSPGMIKALKNSCRGLGIKRIVNDPFKGY